MELVAQPAEDPEDLTAGGRHRPDGHEEGVDDHVLAGDAVVEGAFDDPLRDTESDVGVLADPGLVVADRDDRGAVLPDQRQDPLEALKVLMANGTYQAILRKWELQSAAISNPTINGATR